MRKAIYVALWLVLLPGVVAAKVNTKIENAVAGSFPGVSSIEAKRIILSSGEADAVEKRAGAKLETKIYRYYRFMSEGRCVGYGILVARKVRTKRATVLYAFDASGRLKFAEIMAFGEPPEYIPNVAWMGQFKDRDRGAALKMGKDIPTISGATLSARSISDGARIARAILFTVVMK
jgi:hypothetical protein